MNNKLLFTILLVSLLLIIVGCNYQNNQDNDVSIFQNKCGDGVCDTKEKANPDLCLKDCDISTPNTEHQEQLYFTINIHIEPGTGQYCNDETYYDNGKKILEKLMDSAESVGAKLSVYTEYPFLYGAIQYEEPGDNIITELIQRGHSVGFHSHYESGVFQDDFSNLCEDNEYSLVNRKNYVEHFEYIFGKVLGEKDIYKYTKTGYGAFGESISELQERGIEAIYKEPCGYPEAGENAVYDIAVESRGALLYIPVPKPSAYLSSIYSRTFNKDVNCYVPEYASSAICGKWYDEDFKTVYSAIEKAVELSKDEDGITSTGITFHLHNFNDESKGSCGRDVMFPNYQELEMFEEWLETKIKSLSDDEDIVFANANEIIKIVEKK